MTPALRTCDDCRWLRVWTEDGIPIREARCEWHSLALISFHHRRGDARPAWCDKDKEPAS